MFPKITSYAISALLLLTLLPLQLRGAELKLTPGLAVKEEYNDNLFLTTTRGGRADFITTLTPSLEISSATERSRATLSGGLNQLLYARQDSLDASDYFVRSGIDWRLDPLLSVSAGASYLRDSRPDRFDQDTGLAQTVASSRQNYQLSGSYAVSEKSNLTLSYGYSQEDYAASTQLGTRVHSANLSQDYDLDSWLRQTKLMGTFGYQRSLTDVSQVDYYTLTIGLAGKLHELWGYSLNGGGNLIHSAFEQTVRGTSSTITSENLGWVGNLSLNYSGEKLNGSLGFSHDVSTASGRAGSTERTSVSANLGQRFSRELSASLNLIYSLNKTARNQFSSQTIDETRLSLGCGLKYDISNDMALEGGYRFTNVDYNYGSSPSSAVQNVFMLRLTMVLDLMDL
ncbi:MAG: outer membrane beta-barrel protein [Desulfuromonadales bacterium]|nr:outer membrane beta-barrel protein [Desulfuromonadales bacterium]